MPSDEEIAALYATGLSMANVGRQIGCSEWPVQKALIRLGVERRSRGYRGHPVDPQAILDAYRAGATIAEVAAQTGVGRRTVTRIVQDARIMRQGKRPYRLPVDEIVTRYRAGESSLQIAASIGASARGVRYALKRAGVEMRGKSYRATSG